MTVRAAVLAALLGLGASPALLGANPASAQPYWAGERGYAPYADYDEGLPPRAINRMLRAEGLSPVSPPARRGRNYVVHAADAYGGVKRVIIDARYGEIVSIQAIGRPGPRRFSRGDGFWSDAPPRPRAGLTPQEDERVFAPRPRGRIPSAADAGVPDIRRDSELPAPPHIGAANPQDGGKPATKHSEPPKGERTAVIAPAKPPLPRQRPANLSQPAVVKPDATLPATAPEAKKPDSAQPVVAKPDAPVQDAAKPESKPPESKPVDAKPADGKPADGTPAAEKTPVPAKTATTTATPAAPAGPRVILPGGPKPKGAPEPAAATNPSGAAPVNPLE